MKEIADNERMPSREHEKEKPVCCEKGVNTDVNYDVLLKELREKIEMLENELRIVKRSLEKQRFRLANIAGNDKMVAFYTGFPTYSLLESCFDFLGPAVHHLSYNPRDDENCENPLQIGGRPHALPPLEEFFLVLVRLRLGLFEQDLAYRFGISQSTVSRVINTWINFMFLQFQQVPLWPSRDVVQSYMPQIFKDKYPSTRVIIDATEIYVEQPHLPELQQVTFSKYKKSGFHTGFFAGGDVFQNYKSIPPLTPRKFVLLHVKQLP